ncbi:MAG: 7-cyano-7-deazaguanine synthase [Planctomycetota bacterium]|jgi:7-cyano-7-deazaguanine synthase
MAALALLSGGLDSTVATALYAADGGEVALGLFVDYGQRAADPERMAARAVGQALGFDVLCTDQPLLGEITATALVDRSRDLPEPDPGLLDDSAAAAASADAVWVPNRNGLLVNLAAAVAEARGLDTVVVGFNAEEAATFPDNSPRFLANLNAALADSTRGAVTVACPTLELTKAELLARGRAVGAPVDLAWSCYGGGPEPCGRCESCRRRRRAEGA